MKLFTQSGGVETHCIILTSSILSMSCSSTRDTAESEGQFRTGPDIHADILELAGALPPFLRQALFSRVSEPSEHS